MHSRVRARCLELVLLLVAPVIDLSAQQLSAQNVQQGSQSVRRDAREEAPDALMGTWILNVSKSRYAGQPPKSQRRDFDYTRDGLLLCTYTTVSASGGLTFGHWATTLDGKFYQNFLRSSGATPYSMIAHKRTDDYTIEIVNKQNGRILQTGAYTLSKDGKTLNQTLTATNAQGQRSTNVAVFDKKP